MKLLLVVCGPTGTGKTSLAIHLARSFHGEIISADSRQIYKYMNIGTGKATPEERKKTVHHLLDTVDPAQTYCAADFVKEAVPIIERLWEQKTLPIIEGGTGFYMSALLDGVDSIGVPPDFSFRDTLKYVSKEVLYERLLKLDPKRASTIDRNNPRRLIRALEVVQSKERQVVSTLTYDNVLRIGLTADKKYLFERSDKRLKQAVEGGLIEEIESLLQKGYTWDLPSMSSIWYLPVKAYLEKNETREELTTHLQTETHRYIRRQMTWFKKDARIQWFDIREKELHKKVEEKVTVFLKENA